MLQGREGKGTESSVAGEAERCERRIEDRVEGKRRVEEEAERKVDDGEEGLKVEERWKRREKWKRWKKRKMEDWEVGLKTG